ncbi:MAG: BatD family protein, partial [bacterium]|nr:BatD family protein [bacterium]
MKKGITIAAVFWILTSIFGFICPVSAESIVLKSAVDRTVVGQNENFTLTVEVSGEKANVAADPQIPDISDFAVYLGSSGVSQNIQIINGQMTVSKSHSYIFRAVTLGKFTIPAAVLKFNGKEYRSNPINIEITKASPQKQPPSPRSQPSRPVEQDSETIDGENLFLRVQASKKTAYVNEPI